MSYNQSSLNNLLSKSGCAEKQKENERKVLHFLRDETYSVTRILTQLLDMKTKVGTISALRKLEKKKLIKSHRKRLVGDSCITLWGITTHGVAMSYADEDTFSDDPHFEPYRVGITTLQHTLDIQELRLKAVKFGWQNWVKGNNIFREKGEKIPDAIAQDTRGNVSAIEVERTLKSQKRYAEIMGHYLVQLGKNKYQRLDYICPTYSMARTLKRLVTSLEAVIHKGEWLNTEPDSFQRVYFWEYGKWLEDLV